VASKAVESTPGHFGLWISFELGTLGFDIASPAVSSSALHDLFLREPMLHPLKRKVDESVDQGGGIIPMKPFPNGRERIELLPGPFPALPKCLSAHLHWKEIGG
jgi:hypothetical protein